MRWSYFGPWYVESGSMWDIWLCVRNETPSRRQETVMFLTILHERDWSVTVHISDLLRYYCKNADESLTPDPFIFLNELFSPAPWNFAPTIMKSQINYGVLPLPPLHPQKTHQIPRRRPKITIQPYASKVKTLYGEILLLSFSME